MSRECLKLSSTILMVELQHMPGGNPARDTPTQGLSIPIRCIDHCHGVPQITDQVVIRSHTSLLSAQEHWHLCWAIEAVSSQKAYLPPVAVTWGTIMM